MVSYKEVQVATERKEKSQYWASGTRIVINRANFCILCLSMDKRKKNHCLTMNGMHGSLTEEPEQSTPTISSLIHVTLHLSICKCCREIQISRQRYQRVVWLLMLLSLSRHLPSDACIPLHGVRFPNKILFYPGHLHNISKSAEL